MAARSHIRNSKGQLHKVNATKGFCNNLGQIISWVPEIYTEYILGRMNADSHIYSESQRIIISS